MIEIEAPDGSIIEFPDGTTDDVILSVMRQNFGPTQPATSGVSDRIASAKAGTMIASPENIARAGEADAQAMAMMGQSRPSVMSDVAKSGGAGMLRGGGGLLDVAGLGADLAGALAKYVGMASPEQAQQASSMVRSAVPGGQFTQGVPVSSRLAQATGGASEYRPQTTAGEYAATVGEFLPGAALGGGGIGGLLKYGVGAGLASEAAGQATEGTSMEPFARVAGAVAGPMAISGASRAARSAISPLGGADPERLKLAKVLDDYGVPITAGQRTGSQGLQRIEGNTGAGQRIQGAQSEAFTREVLKTAGVNAERATPEVMAKAFKDLGQVFDDVVQGVDVTPDAAALTKMSGALRTYRDLTPSANVPPILGNVNKELVRSFRSGNAIPASTVKTWRSTLSKLTTSSDAATREAAQAAIEAVDDAINSALVAAGKPEAVAALTTARGQYRNLLAIERAAAQAGTSAREGILSPKAVARAVSGQSRRSFVTGRRGDLGQLARAGEDILSPLPTVSEGGVRGIRGAAEALSVGGGAALGGPLGAMAGLIAPTVGRAAMMNPIMQRYLANQAVGPASSSGSMLGIIPGLLAQ